MRRGTEEGTVPAIDTLEAAPAARIALALCQVSRQRRQYANIRGLNQGCGSGWIHINLSCWMYLDPDPGGQKYTAKIEKSKDFSGLECWMFSFEG